MQLKDPPFDYRDEMSDADVVSCIEYAVYRKAWNEVPYWNLIMINRERRAKGLEPR